MRLNILKSIPLIACFMACEDEPKVMLDILSSDASLNSDLTMPSYTDGSLDQMIDQDVAIYDQEASFDQGTDLEVDGEIMDASHPSRPHPPLTSTLTQPSNFTWGRGLIHMHSVHSHDACDGDPKPNGLPNLPCLQDLRAAVCSSRLDFMLLTDHPVSFMDVDFVEATLYNAASGDRLIYNSEGLVIGNRLKCSDDHEVLIAPGTESALMPVMLTQKPENPNWHGTRAPESVRGLREAGAVVLHAHTEQRTFEELWPLGLDGFEIYNLHANVNPRGEQLREVITDLTTTLRAGSTGPHPDLSLLAILRENRWALSMWDLFIPHTRALGFAGSDIHQNLPPRLFQTYDGERLDSYRRLTRWFANYVLLEERSLDGLRAALLAGRLYTVFHLLGEPEGIDFYADNGEGARYEMGSELTFQEGITVHIHPPSPPAGSEINVRVYRISTREETAQPGDEVEKTLLVESMNTNPIAVEVDQPGAYRVEISQTPIHLRAELGTLAELLIRPTIWIYSNPIYVR